MTTLEAILLGIVQAITEFLPVSSSGHLVVFRSLWDIKDSPVVFDVLLHIGTTLATIFFYRNRIIWILKGLGRWTTSTLSRIRPADEEAKEALRMTGLILLSCLVTGVLGMPLKSVFESLFENPTAVGVAFLITASLLLLTKNHQVNLETEGIERITWKMAVIIGVAQFAAITPGISRSGMTIAAALLLGLQRKKAAEFSFLISIPAVLGANLIQLRGGTLDVALSTVLVGITVAFVFGLTALSFLVYLVKKGTFYQFSFYLYPLGVLVLIGALTGFLG